MAQIIKQRRGSITQLKDVTARISELVVATGSIGNLNGPFLFVGETEGVAGAYRPISKIYQGSAAPTITIGSYGSILDGTPFYASADKSLYILSQAGNSRMDFTGNIEGNTISNVTITSLTGSNAVVTNITGTTITGSNVRVTNDLNVGGKVTVTGDISGSNLNLTGNATIDGDIVLKGNISIGNQTTDLVTFGADVSSSILPDVHNAFDLGSSEKNWRNLHVSGTAYVQTLQVNQVTVTNIDVTGDLRVSGSTFLGNGGDSTVISGSIYNDQLTDNRVLIAGPNGEIEDSQYFTYDEVTLKVGTGTGNFEVGVASGDIRTSGSLLVKSGATFTGSLNLNGSQTISDNLIVSGNVYLGDMSNDSTIVSGTLYTHNTTYLGDMNTSMGDALIVSGGIKVRGTQVISDDLIVSGNVYLGDISTDNTIISGTLRTHNTTHLGDMNTVFGDALIVSGGVKVSGSQTISDNLVVSGNVYLGNDQGDNAIVSGTLYTHNTTHIGNMNTLFGNALIISGAVKQVGDSNINGNVTMTGSLTNSGSLNISGGASVTGAFTVGSGSITSLGGDLYVSGNLQVLGSSTTVSIQSQTVELDDNIIRLNAYSPFQRYAGFEVMDSGSSGVSASMLWDSQNDYWIVTNQNGSGSKFVGTTFGAQGSEVNLTSGTFPIATSNNTIGDSLLTDNATTLSYNTNKFQVTASDGATLIAGNVTVSSAGGSDSGTKTSRVVFRNSSNVLGYVSATESTDVLDGILGYKNSDGALKFSTLIDGGTY